MYNKGWCIVSNDNSTKILVSFLEPLISDLDENKKNLSDRKEELESVSRLIAYTKDHIETVGVYADQDIILSNLDKLKYSQEDYKASCYLLKSENEQVRKLPQYEHAYNLISDVIEYFKLHKAELIVEIEELKNICKEKELEKKYYDIFSNPYPRVDNVKEFVELLNTHEFSKEDIVNILYETVENNIVSYREKE